jgi:hypothetical protein
MTSMPFWMKAVTSMLFWMKAMTSIHGGPNRVLACDGPNWAPSFPSRHPTKALTWVVKMAIDIYYLCAAGKKFFGYGFGYESVPTGMGMDSI